MIPHTYQPQDWIETKTGEALARDTVLKQMLRDEKQWDNSKIIDCYEKLFIHSAKVFFECDGGSVGPNVNADYMFYTMDVAIWKNILGHSGEEQMPCTTKSKWNAREKTERPWPIQYGVYFHNRAFLDGEGAHVTRPDGTVVKNVYSLKDSAKKAEATDSQEANLEIANLKNTLTLAQADVAEAQSSSARDRSLLEKQNVYIDSLKDQLSSSQCEVVRALASWNEAVAALKQVDSSLQEYEQNDDNLKAEWEALRKEQEQHKHNVAQLEASTSLPDTDNELIVRCENDEEREYLQRGIAAYRNRVAVDQQKAQQAEDLAKASSLLDKRYEDTDTSKMLRNTLTCHGLGDYTVEKELPWYKFSGTIKVHSEKAFLQDAWKRADCMAGRRKLAGLREFEVFVNIATSDMFRQMTHMHGDTEPLYEALPRAVAILQPNGCSDKLLVTLKKRDDIKVADIVPEHYRQLAETFCNVERWALDISADFFKNKNNKTRVEYETLAQGLKRLTKSQKSARLASHAEYIERKEITVARTVLGHPQQTEIPLRPKPQQKKADMRLDAQNKIDSIMSSSDQTPQGKWIDVIVWLRGQKPVLADSDYKHLQEAARQIFETKLSAQERGEIRSLIDTTLA